MALQRILPSRLQELGRIRVGDQVPLANKKGTRPRRLEAFRLTSTNKPRLEYAATLWGGEVRKWDEAPVEKSWELYLDKDTLPVVVPPFHAISQVNEIWQGSECRLRCNGEQITTCPKDEDRIGQPCYCARFSLKERLEKAKTGEACHTITRLNLLLPDVPGVGVWRFDTGSFYAGMELQGNTELLEQASAEGCYIECLLQIEERRVVRTVAGKPQTQVFSVVTLQPEVTMRQLLSRQIPPAALVGKPVTALAITGPQAAAALYGGEAEDYTPTPPPQPPAPRAPAADAWRDELWGLMLQFPEADPYRIDLVCACEHTALTLEQGQELVKEARQRLAQPRPAADKAETSESSAKEALRETLCQLLAHLPDDDPLRPQLVAAHKNLALSLMQLEEWEAKGRERLREVGEATGK